jgi:hypothetical protein
MMRRCTARSGGAPEQNKTMLGGTIDCHRLTRRVRHFFAGQSDLQSGIDCDETIRALPVL